MGQTSPWGEPCPGDREQSDEEGWEQKLGAWGKDPCWRPEQEEGVFME